MSGDPTYVLSRTDKPGGDDGLRTLLASLLASLLTSLLDCLPACFGAPQESAGLKNV
jgi:hypothetical protein